jgi:type I restriction enzyme, S subunit
MSSDWPTVRLGDHVDACLGKMLDAKKNKGTPQPYLGNSNVRWGQFDLNDLAEMRFEPHEEERYSLKPGDLVVCEGGEPGRCAIWTGPAGMKVQKALHRIRPKDTLDNYYLFYWFQLSAKAGLLEPHFTGTTIKHLTGKAIAALEVPLPSIEVQRAMVDVLKQLDDRITLLRETYTTLEAIAQALFKSWFVDFDPVHAKMQGRVPEGMDETTAALFPDSFEEPELGAAPKGWRIGTLADLATFQNGYAFKSKDWSEAGHPVIKIGNVKPSLISFDGCSFVAAESVIGLDRFKLKRGDLLVGMTGYVGETGLVTEVSPAAYLNQRVGRIATFAGIKDLGFVFCLTRHEDFKAFAEGQSHGSAQANVSGSDLLKFKSVIPSNKILSAFNEVMESLIDSIISNHEQAQMLSMLRDTLLPRLISGQLRFVPTD